MTKTIRFYKVPCSQEENNVNKGWYADIAGHTMEENQMVSGSDDFLEQADSLLGGRGEVTIEVSDTIDVSGSPFIAKLDMKSHNQWGATYTLSGPLAQEYDAVGFQLWICNVTHDVLGEHPRTIYIFDVR